MNSKTSNKLLSDIVAFRTYAKYLQHLQRRETLEETINRSMNMHLEKFPKLSKDIVKAFSRVHELKVMGSMRASQFAGDAILKNNARIFNCSYAPIEDTRIFSEALFLLLSGVGFGFSVQSKHVTKLPKVIGPKEDGMFYVVHDSIQGWAEALNQLIEAYFHGKIKPTFDFGNIRPKGSYLVTTGAKAPGPEPLKHMLQLVDEKLKAAIGRKLRPIEVHDLVCIISDSVLAGGIRRSALISLFDYGDNEMLLSKSGSWWEKHPYRARANNSVILNRKTVTKKQFMEVFNACKNSGSGEPGIYFTNDESMDYGTNPCCLTGDSLIAVADGRNAVQIKDLVGTVYDVYTIKDGRVTIGRAINTIKTKENAEVWKLTMGDGSEVKATPDHKFMLRSGEYKMLMDLKPGDSLMPYCSRNGNNGARTVLNIEVCGNEDVYDIEVEETHNFAVISSASNNSGELSGVFVHNCEISLQPYQFCNLSTINQTGIKDEKDFMNRVYAATLIGTLQASYTDFHYLSPRWKNVTEQDSLLGVSFTGIADGGVKSSLLESGAKFAKEVNLKYADKIDTNPAARITCVKPEGSSSTILGSSSGIHARHSQYYIRRIRMNKADALAVYLKSVVPDLVEDDKFSSGGVVVSIPQMSPEGSILRESESALDLFHRTIMYNNKWIVPGHTSGPNHHNVSVTLSVKDNEWDELGEEMWKHRESFHGISLLPYDGGTYIQAPFESFTKEQYEHMSSLVRDVDLTQVKEEDDKTSRGETVACAGGACLIE